MFFNRQILTLGQRHIPDPEVLERPFVAIPLAEIAPNYKHPETGQSLRHIAGTLFDKSKDMHLRQDISRQLTQVAQSLTSQ